MGIHAGPHDASACEERSGVGWLMAQWDTNGMGAVSVFPAMTVRIYTWFITQCVFECRRVMNQPEIIWVTTCNFM